MDIGFKKCNYDKTNTISILENWKSEFENKSKHKFECKNLKVAYSIINQSITSLNEQRHGHFWVAKRGEKVCSILIADDQKDEFVIRFLVANILDSEARGSGTFLVETMLELANKTHKTVRTTPENSDKYWKNKMGFQPDQNNPVEYIYKTHTPNDLSVKKKKK